MFSIGHGLNKDQLLVVCTKICSALEFFFLFYFIYYRAVCLFIFSENFFHSRCFVFGCILKQRVQFRTRSIIVFEFCFFFSSLRRIRLGFLFVFIVAKSLLPPYSATTASVDRCKLDYKLINNRVRIDAYVNNTVDGHFLTVINRIGFFLLFR